MGEAMVTGRMAPGKKRRGGQILHREGLTASQAINRMYDCLIEKGDASFLTGNIVAEDEEAWFRAADLVDALSEKKKVAPLTSPFAPIPAAAPAGAQPQAQDANPEASPEDAARAARSNLAAKAQSGSIPTPVGAPSERAVHSAEEQGAN